MKGTGRDGGANSASRVGGALLPGLLIAALAFSGCQGCGPQPPSDGGPSDGGAPALTITSPLNGATITRVEDNDPNQDGIQIAVEVAVTGTLKGDASPKLTNSATPDVEYDGTVSDDGTEILFEGVTIAASAEPGTENVIAVTATGADGHSVTVTGLVGPLPVEPFCEITEPASGATVSDADANTGGVQIQVSVRCGGDGVVTGMTIEVTATDDNSGESRTQLGTLAGAGEGNFTANLVVTSPADNTPVTLIASQVDLNVESAPVPVTVPELNACDATLSEPADGAVFDLSATDQDDNAPGFQQVIVVTTGDTACAGADANVSVSDGTTTEAFTAVVAADGTAEVTVTLPDGALTITAEVANEAGTGASDSVQVTVDRTAPLIALTSPSDGAVYGPTADLDGDPLNGVSLELAGAITGATTASYDLSCTGDNTATQSGDLTLGQDGTLTAVTLADLPQSSCTLTVNASDGRNDAQAVLAFQIAVIDVSVSLGGDGDGNGYWIASEDQTAGGDMDIPLSLTVTFGADGTTYTATARVIRVSDDQEVQSLDLGTLTSGVAATGTLVLPYGEEAEYRLEVTVTPSAGDVIGPATRRFFVDTVAPTLTWQAPGDNQRLNAAADQQPQTEGFQGFFALNTTGLAAGSVVGLELSGASTVADTCAVAANALCIKSITVPDGDWTATATATDPAGNAAAPVARSFTVDATLPTVQSIVVAADTEDAAGTSSPDGVLNRAENRGNVGNAASDVTVTFLASAGLEDGRTVTLTVQPGQSYNASVSGNVATFSGVALAEGNLTLSVSATDLAGNPVAAAGKSRGFRVDTTPPTVAIAAPTGTVIAAAMVNVVLTTDAEDGQTALLHDVTGGGEVLLGSVLVASGGATFENVVLQQGARTLRVTVVDLAGNQSTATRDYTVDSQPPTLTLTVSSDATADADLVAPGWQVDFTVDHSGLEAGQHIDLVSDQSGVRGSASADASGTTLIRATFTTSAAHSMTAVAEDAAGNLGTSSPVQVTIDTGDYNVFLDSPAVVAGKLLFGAAHVSGTTATVVLTVPTVQASATALLLIDGVVEPTANVTQAGETFTVTWTVAEGETGTLEVTVADGVNTGTTGVYNYEIDGAAPTVAWGAATPTVFGIAADEQSSVGGLQYTAQIDVTECENGTLEVLEGATRIGGPVSVGASGSGTIAVLIEDATEHDSSTWTARCTDLARGEGSADVTTKVDLTAPAVPSLTLTVIDSRRGQIRVEFSAPGDDGSAGAPASIQVVASRSEITAGNFDDVVALPTLPGTGGLVDSSTTATPGATYTAQTEFLAFDNDWYVGVRAVDDVGNASFGFALETGLVTSVVTFTNVEDDTGAGATTADAYGYGSAESGDLNGDGRMDLVVVARNEGDTCPLAGLCNGVLRIYQGVDDLGTLALGREITVPNTFSLGHRFTIVPSIDGDAFDDLIVAAYDATSFEQELLFFYGTDATSAGAPDLVESPVAVNLASNYLDSVRALGDVNGDGLPDVGIGPLSGFNDKRFTILFGSGTRPADGVALTSLSHALVEEDDPSSGKILAIGVGVANLDGDTSAAGHPLDDLVVDGAASVFVVRGRETWPVPPATLAVSTLPLADVIPCAAANCGREISSGDVDGDGAVDLVMFGGASGALSVFRGSGGAFPATQTYSLEPGRPGVAAALGGLAVGDVNGDGADDVLVTALSDAANPSGFLVYLGGTYAEGAGLAAGKRVLPDAQYPIPFNLGAPGRVGQCGDPNNDGLDELCFGSELGDGSYSVRY